MEHGTKQSRLIVLLRVIISDLRKERYQVKEEDVGRKTSFCYDFYTRESESLLSA